MENVDLSSDKIVRKLICAQIANRRMIMALVASHPNPDVLRYEWNRNLAVSLLDSELSDIPEEQREGLRQGVGHQFDAWDDLLDVLLP